MENDFEDFCKRFWNLQEDAKSYGIETVVGFHQSDHLGEETLTSTQFCGSKTVAIGMMDVAKHNLLNRESEPIN
jgi:hypothetical protein